MAIKRVTMLDIANACGLSRNTVSKIFNNRGAVPESTRQMVKEKAAELGYYSAVPKPATSTFSMQSKYITLLTVHLPSSDHFGTLFIPSFADQLSREGYTLTICEISSEELAEKKLPYHMSVEQTAGILAIELFDREYHNMLCNLGVPVLFIDSYSDSNMDIMKCDMISMENITSSHALVANVIELGAKNIGFVGDIEHCNSFYERWIGYCSALSQANLPINRSLCILEPDNSSSYGNPEWLFSKVRSMSVLPDAFICANDFIAINLMYTLKQHNISIPETVMITGFDGTPQSSIIDPSLTTAYIPSSVIGRMAAETILARIDNPSRPFQRIYVSTTPKFRRSTDALNNSDYTDPNLLYT